MNNGIISNVKLIRMLSIIAISASFVSAGADVLLLYDPAGGYATFDYEFLKDIPEWRILIGYYLGIFFIPLLLLGAVQVYKTIKQAGTLILSLLLFLSVLLVVSGVLYHGSLGQVRLFIENKSITSDYLNLIRPLEYFMGIAFVVISFILAYMVLWKKTNHRKGFILFNPGIIYILCIVLYRFFPLIGNLVIVAAFNLSLGMFFIGSLLMEIKSR